MQSFENGDALNARNARNGREGYRSLGHEERRGSHCVAEDVCTCQGAVAGLLVDTEKHQSKW